MKRRSKVSNSRLGALSNAIPNIQNPTLFSGTTSLKSPNGGKSRNDRFKLAQSFNTATSIAEKVSSKDSLVNLNAINGAKSDFYKFRNSQAKIKISEVSSSTKDKLSTDELPSIVKPSNIHLNQSDDHNHCISPTLKKGSTKATKFKISQLIDEANESLLQ